MATVAHRSEHEHPRWWARTANGKQRRGGIRTFLSPLCLEWDAQAAIALRGDWPELPRLHNGPAGSWRKSLPGGELAARS